MIHAFNGFVPSYPDNGRFFVAENATLIGQVSLAEDCSIWFGAVLRGDNEPIVLGERTNIQDLCMVHTDPGFPVSVGADCTIGHRAIIHGCTIMDNSLIGMGAIILNGAVIGRNCLIGAGALIPENRAIPDSSLVVGSPGKVVRAIDEDGARRIRESARSYVAKWPSYAAARS